METKLVKRHQELGDVWSFYFAKPNGYRYEAGDYLELSLDYGTSGGRRWFTIASSPHETYLQITTRIPTPRSDFKQSLKNLKIGDPAWVSPPMGNFNLPIIPDKLLFIAGGVGVTPYRSILTHLAYTPVDHDICLLYSAHSENYIFLNELMNSVANTIHYHEHNNRIDLDHFDLLVPDWYKRLIFLAGPETMMTNLHDKLIVSGHPRYRIRLCYFPGYTEI